MERWLWLIEAQPGLHEGDKWVTFLISKFHFFIHLKKLAFELSAMSDACAFVVGFGGFRLIPT